MTGGITSTAAGVNVVSAMLYSAVGTDLPPYVYHVSDPATVEEPAAIRAAKMPAIVSSSPLGRARAAQ
jgi:hypothetical protein